MFSSPIYPLRRTFAIAISVLPIAVLAISSPTHAQHVGAFGQSSNPANNNAYFASADYTITTAISDYDIFVGKSDTSDPATNFETLTSAIPVTLTVADNGFYGYNPGNPVYPDGKTHRGINAFGNNILNVGGLTNTLNGYDTSTINILSIAMGGNGDAGGGLAFSISNYDESNLNLFGGTLYNVQGYNKSTINIFDGSFSYIYGSDENTINMIDGFVQGIAQFNTGTINISGGTLGEVGNLGTSTTNITGGDVSSTILYDSGMVNLMGGSLSFGMLSNSSSINISGGTVTEGILLEHSTTSANFIGTDLSYQYMGTNINGFFGGYDQFTITGNIGGVTNSSVNLFIIAGGPGNSTPRQFSFNGVAVTVPEVGTVGLALPLICCLAVARLGGVSAGGLHRRKISKMPS